MAINSNTTVSVGLVISLVAGGVAWGSLKTTVDRHEKDINVLSEKMDKVLDSQQQLLKMQSKALSRICKEDL